MCTYQYSEFTLCDFASVSPHLVQNLTIFGDIHIWPVDCDDFGKYFIPTLLCKRIHAADTMSNPKADVFISFSSKNANFAHRLNESLRRNGFSTFSFLDISAGDDWVALTQRALAESRFVVAVLSEAYRSEEHTSELQSHLNLVCR